jgi:hypothetical protein
MKYIIDFIDTATQDEIDAWMVSQSITTFSRVTTQTNVFLVETSTEPAVTELVEAVVEDSNVSMQLLNTVEVIPASTGEEGSFDVAADWWKTASASNVAFDAETSTYEKRGSKTNVYIVDSGAKIDHPDFVGAKIENLFTFSDDFTDERGHGTAMASLIVGNTLGITNSTVKNVKVFDNTKSTMLSDLVAAFDAIHADMLSNPAKMAVVNLSWSIPKNEYLEAKIQRVIDAGAFVVASAGNSGVPIENVTPASMATVHTIGAFTEDFKPADFSNYTSVVSNTEGEVNYGALDGWAPGANINVATITDGISTASGTSISAAIMTACVAFNSDLLYTIEGPVVANMIMLAQMSLGKRDMLIFSEKYEGSVNRYSSFVTEASSGLTAGTYSASHLIYPNTDVSFLVAMNAFTTKIEIDGVLPDGLSLSNGWLVGKITNPPTEGTATHQYTVTVTFNSGAVNTYPMTLFVATEELTYGDHPVDVTLHFCRMSNGCTGMCTDEGGVYCFTCDKMSCQCDNQVCT